MRVLVVDNNVFSHSFKNLSMDVFDDIWEPWSQLMHSGRIISVDEVYRELQVWVMSGKPKDRISQWLKAHKNYFYQLTNEEGYVLKDIFASQKFREGIKEKSLRMGSPEADAILVAKAKCINGIVVTAESDEKPNSEKVPNICTSLDVPYMRKDDFYKLLRNVHHGRSESKEVCVCKSLGVPEPFIP